MCPISSSGQFKSSQPLDRSTTSIIWHIYIPPLHLSPIASGIDVANSNTLFKSMEQQDPHKQCNPSSNSSSFIIHMADNQNDTYEAESATTPIDIGIECNLDDDIENDVRLTALLSKIDKANNPSEHPETSEYECAQDPLLENVDVKDIDANEEQISITENVDQSESCNQVVGNLVTLNRGWSSDCGIELAESPPLIIGDAYSQLVSQHDLTVATTNDLRRSESNLSFPQNILDEIWIQFQNISEPKIVAIEADNMEANESLIKEFSDDYLQQMVYCSYRIPQQLGLDEQNFTCSSCENPLGVGGGEQATAM